MLSENNSGYFLSFELNLEDLLPPINAKWLKLIILRSKMGKVLYKASACKSKNIYTVHFIACSHSKSYIFRCSVKFFLLFRSNAHCIQKKKLCLR